MIFFLHKTSKEIIRFAHKADNNNISLSLGFLTLVPMEKMQKFTFSVIFTNLKKVGWFNPPPPNQKYS